MFVCDWLADWLTESWLADFTDVTLVSEDTDDPDDPDDHDNHDDHDEIYWKELILSKRSSNDKR